MLKGNWQTNRVTHTLTHSHAHMENERIEHELHKLSLRLNGKNAISIGAVAAERRANTRGNAIQSNIAQKYRNGNKRNRHSKAHTHTNGILQQNRNFRRKLGERAQVLCKLVAKQMAKRTQANLLALSVLVSCERVLAARIVELLCLAEGEARLACAGRHANTA